MPSKEKKAELFKKIHDAVVEFEEETTRDLCKEALEVGIDAYDAVMAGLTRGMDTVGGLYEKNEYFVPELLLCSDAMYAGLEVLRPHIKVKSGKVNGKIIIGVVEGDIHDIGKSLVKTMFEAASWDIFDLGKDVKLQNFVEELARTNADVVAMSALMTTSMLAMPKLIDMLKAQKPDVIIMVGGAPLSEEIAGQYGADGYAEDAVLAVKEAQRLLEASL
ncbi:MAG: cobalamin-binding protein [Desulfobacteraceae bacterium 4572_123]|nr:MAG: cobalamin-binding protein [Desulfobacteraceae bacterium 4572_123]